MAVQAVQETTLKGSISPIEAYSCDLHVLNAVQDIQQVIYMTLEDWQQAQQADPVLSLVIARLQDGTLGKGHSNVTDPSKVSQYRWECNHLLLKQGILYRQARPKGRPSFSWSCQLHRGRLLSEGATMRLVIWAWSTSTCLISCVTGSSRITWLLRQENTFGSVMHAFPPKPASPKPPLKTSWPHTL